MSQVPINDPITPSATQNVATGASNLNQTYAIDTQAGMQQQAIAARAAEAEKMRAFDQGIFEKQQKIEMAKQQYIHSMMRAGVEADADFDATIADFSRRYGIETAARQAALTLAGKTTEDIAGMHDKMEKMVSTLVDAKTQAGQSAYSSVGTALPKVLTDIAMKLEEEEGTSPFGEKGIVQDTAQTLPKTLLGTYVGRQAANLFGFLSSGEMGVGDKGQAALEKNQGEEKKRGVPEGPRAQRMVKALPDSRQLATNVAQQAAREWGASMGVGDRLAIEMPGIVNDLLAYADTVRAGGNVDGKAEAIRVKVTEVADKMGMDPYVLRTMLDAVGEQTRELADQSKWDEAMKMAGADLQKRMANRLGEPERAKLRESLAAIQSPLKMASAAVLGNDFVADPGDLARLPAMMQEALAQGQEFNIDTQRRLLLNKTQIASLENIGARYRTKEAARRAAVAEAAKRTEAVADLEQERKLGEGAAKRKAAARFGETARRAGEELTKAVEQPVKK